MTSRTEVTETRIVEQEEASVEIEVQTLVTTEIPASLEIDLERLLISQPVQVDRIELVENDLGFRRTVFGDTETRIDDFLIPELGGD